MSSFHSLPPHSSSPLLPPVIPPRTPRWITLTNRNWGWQALLRTEKELASAAAQEPGWCSLGVLQAPDSLQGGTGGNSIPPRGLTCSSLNSRPLSTSFLSIFGFQDSERRKGSLKGTGAADGPALLGKGCVNIFCPAGQLCSVVLV